MAGTEVAKQQLEEEGEDTADYIVQTVSKTQKKIAQLTKTSKNKDGVNVLDPNGNLRDTYDILLDIAKVYKEIQSDDQKYGTNRANAIVEYIAGKNRSNIAASILQNPGLLEDVYETAKNSEGSAIQENEKYLDSIAGKMQQLTNSAQEFATEFLDSEVVKGITGLLADIVQLGTKGVSSFNALQIAATAFFGVIGAKNLNMKHIKDVFLSDKAQYGTGNAILAQFGLGQHKRDKAAFSNFKAEYEAMSNGIIGPVPQDEALKLVNKHMKDAGSAVTLLTEKVAKQKITMDEASESLKNMSFKSRLAGVGWSILGGAISSVLGLAISSVISILIEQITASGEAAKQAAENVNKFNEAYSDSHQKLSEASRTIDEVKEEYFELSKGVSESGENLSLSNSQYSRYKAIVEQLSGVMPNLTTLFNEQGEAIGFAGGKIDDFNNKLLEMQQNLARKNLYGDDGQQNALNDAVTVFNKKFSQEIENKTGPFMNWITAGGNADISLFSNKNEVLDFLKLLSESSPQQILENLNTQIDTSSVGGVVDSLVNSPKEANLKAFKNYIKEYIGLTDEEIEKLVTNNPNELINRLRSSYDKLKAELDNDVISLRNAMKDYVTVGYQNLNLDDKKIADGIIDAFNPQDLKDKLGKDILEDSDITSWINNMVNTIESHHEEVSSAFTGLFKLDISDMPVEEARQAIEDFIAILASWFPDLDIGKLLEKAGLNGFYNNTVPAYERAIAIGSDGEYTDENGIHRKITGRNIASKEEIRDAMINRGINTDEEINAWTEAEQTATNMTDLLNKYNQIINNSKESTKSFGRVWAELNDSVKDSDKSTIEELKELASTGKLTADVIEEKYMTAFKDTGLSAEELAKKINSLVDEIKRLATLEAGINNIQEVFKEKKEAKDKKPKEQSLDALGDKLEVSTWKGKDLKVWKDYKKLAIDGNTSTKKMKKAQNELATSYARTHNFLAGLNEENKEYYINSLKEIGVKNAAQVVNSELIAQEWDLREAKLGGLTATFDLSTATDTEIQKLAGEAAQLGITKGQLFDYIVEKTAANSHGILTGGDISNLENLRTALGLATDDLIYYKKVKDWASNGGGTKYTKKGKNIYKGANGSATGVDHARRFGKVKTTTTSTPKRKKPKRDEWILGDGKGGTNTNGGGGGGRGSGTDKSQKKTKEYIDWIERRITRISNIISKIGAQLENIGKWGSKFKKGKFLDLGTLSDSTDNKRVSKMQSRYKDEIKYYQNLYKVQEIAEKKYDKKAKNYATGKTAKKLFGKKGIPSKIMKRIKNGDTTLLSSGWYQKLSSDQKSLVDKVIDFYDKGRNAKQAKEEAASSARQAKEASYQVAQEKFDTRIGRAEAKEAMAVGYERQNKFVKIQIDNMKKSYDQQIEIAKLEGNFAEAERLRYEAMQKEKELLVHELDNLAETYNLQRGINNRRIQDVDNLINVAKARGTRATLSWYNDKNLNEERNIASYQDEILKYEALAAKNLAQYGEDSPEYQNAFEHIQELENNIAQSNQNIAENTSALHDAWNQAYDDMRANNKRSADNLNTVIGFDRGESIDTIHRGADSYYRFTQSGLAKFGGANASYVAASNSAGLSLEQYNLMKKANEEYQKATTEEEKQKILQGASVNSYEDLVKKEQGYYDKYLSDRKDMYDAEQKIIDLMTEYYESQKTYLSELIDAKKKILDEEKDLYDYERNINEKTKSISDIQKQLAAIRGDNSEEGKARQQRLQNQLDEAQKALDDEEYNRWKTDQESMLDNLQTQFDDIIDKHLKDQNELLQDGNELISQQGDAIQKAVGNIFTENSIPLSSDLAEIKTALGTKGLGGVFSNLNSNISRWLETNGLGSTPTNSNGSDPDNDDKHPETTSNPEGTKGSSEGTTTVTPGKTYSMSVSMFPKDKKVEKAIKKLGVTPSKEKKTYSKFNQAIWTFAKNDPNIKKKKIIKEKDFPEFAKMVFGDGSSYEKKLSAGKSPSTALYELLKGKASGFKTGGIGRLVKASGEDGIAMVRNGEGFVMPEHVPAMQNLLDITPQLDNIVNSVNKNGSGNINNFGGFTFELPNVTDARSLINEFQNSKDMQKLLKISVEDLVGKGTYSNRIHSV